ncbi:MAG: FMN-binding protein [Rhodobacteraceae bacterium]|nr:FMN-binding protein [Paracoccaceae bacterium]
MFIVRLLIISVFFLPVLDVRHAARAADTIARSEITEAAPGEIAELKEMFPAADVFGEKSGQRPHYRAYKVDPATGGLVLAGFVFRADEVEPDEFAYASSIEMLVGLTVDGKITKIKILRHIEPFGYFSIDPPEFSAQFAGKSILDSFEAGYDVDAVTGATITVDGTLRVIRKSTRAIARQYLREQKGEK